VEASQAGVTSAPGWLEPHWRLTVPPRFQIKTVSLPQGPLARAASLVVLAVLLPVVALIGLGLTLIFLPITLFLGWRLLKKTQRVVLHPPSNPDVLSTPPSGEIIEGEVIDSREVR
jgi:hypothetical protein